MLTEHRGERRSSEGVSAKRAAGRGWRIAPAGKATEQWVCQPMELGVDDRICGVCRKQRLEPCVAECSNCGATILWDLG
jgi:hypothetical protein